MTPISTVLLEKQTVALSLKKFPEYYGTRMFITMLTRACHRFLSWIRRIQSTPSHSISLRSILISSHIYLGLVNGPFPRGFPTKTSYAFLFHECYMHFQFHPPRLDYYNIICRGVQVMKLLIITHSFLQPPIISSHLDPNILLRSLFYVLPLMTFTWQPS
jgi:hypothetical protein